ncbi:hypothetical protein BH11PLA2_BH11PLA2_44940 [soil metagenome]
MRQRMMLLVAALVGFAASASAQAPLQAPLQKPAVNTAPIQQVRGSGTPTVPVVVNGCGSCATGDVAASKHHLRIGAGTINPVSCGCLASEKTFMFGSCKQFFNPQNVCGGGCTAGGCGNGCKGGLGNRNPCALPTYGPGIGQPANNCVGPFTYMNR